MAYVAAIHRWFEDWDFLLTPSVSVAAFPAELLMPKHWPHHDWDWLSLGGILLSVQHVLESCRQRAMRLHRRRLPVGLQIVGRRFDDLGVLQASAAFEQVQPWADKRPTIA